MAVDPIEVALEITPPAAPRPAVLLRRAQALLPACRRVNVIQRPDRQSSLDAAIALLADGLEPVWHLSNRGRSVSEVEGLIERARRAGLARVLCIRGEYKGVESPATDEPKIREMVRMLLRAIPGVRISVTLNPHGLTGPTLDNLWLKLEAGARGVQTQVVFDLEALQPLAQEVKRRHPDVSISPMLMPVLSSQAALRVSRRLGVAVPMALLEDLETRGEEAGWRHFECLVRQIENSALYSGLALMTPIDPSAGFLARLRAAFRSEALR